MGMEETKLRVNTTEGKNRENKDGFSDIFGSLKVLRSKRE